MSSSQAPYRLASGKRAESSRAGIVARFPRVAMLFSLLVLFEEDPLAELGSSHASRASLCWALLRFYLPEGAFASPLVFCHHIRQLLSVKINADNGITTAGLISQ